MTLAKVIATASTLGELFEASGFWCSTIGPMGLHLEDALAVKYLRLVLCVTPEHVRATGLEIPRGNQDHIAILDPDPPLHLASYATHSVGSV